MMKIIKEYMLATRPWSFTAGIIPVLVTASTLNGWKWSELIRSILMAVSIQAGANLTNTYFDFVNGVDNKDTLCGEKTLVDKKITTNGVLILLTICYLIGIGTLLPIIIQFNNPNLSIIFSVGLLLAFFYTANPIGLKYRCLGDITIFLCFGPLLMQCTSILLIDRMDSLLYLYSIPITLLTEGILHANNARDIEADSKAGAATLATVLGLELSYVFYILLIFGAYTSILIISFYYHYGCMAAFLTIPLAQDLNFKFKTGKMLELPEDTAKMHLPFGVLMLLGITLSPYGFIEFL